MSEERFENTVLPAIFPAEPDRMSACGKCAGKPGGCCGASGRSSAVGRQIPGSNAVIGKASETVYVCDHDGFDSDTLAPSYNSLGAPREHGWSLTERPGFLRMRLCPEFPGEPSNPCFIVRQQQHATFTASAELEFRPDLEGQWAGLILLQGDASHFRLAVARSGDSVNIRLVCTEKGIISMEAEAELLTLEELAGNPLRLILRVEAQGRDLRFLCGLEESRMAVLAEHVDARKACAGTACADVPCGNVAETACADVADKACADVAGGFPFAYVGMFAERRNPTGTTVADFDSFTYEGF